MKILEQKKVEWWQKYECLEPNQTSIMESFSEKRKQFLAESNGGPSQMFDRVLNTLQYVYIRL